MLVEAGFEYVARSSALSPFQGLLRRSETCTVDAYLGPVISEYLHAGGEGSGRGHVRPARHDLGRRTGRRRRIPVDGQPPQRPRRWSGRSGADRASVRPRPGDRLRHGRHQHGRLTIRRRFRVRIFAPGRSGGAGRAGTRDRDGRRRRRLDLPGRAGEAGGRARRARARCRARQAMAPADR